jgi:hypothetical protein
MRSGGGEEAIGFLLLVNALHFIYAAAERLIAFDHTEIDIDEVSQNRGQGGG